MFKRESSRKSRRSAENVTNYNRFKVKLFIEQNAVFEFN